MWNTNNEFVLPELTKEYRLQHSYDKPIMLYPGEAVDTFYDNEVAIAYITSFGRVFNIHRNIFLNNGQPIIKKTCSIIINKVKHDINVTAFITEHWPDAAIIVQKPAKRIASKRDMEIFTDWYDKAMQDGLINDDTTNIDVARQFKYTTGINIHHQTVWLHRHPDAKRAMMERANVNKSSKKAYDHER